MTTPEAVVLREILETLRQGMGLGLALFDGEYSENQRKVAQDWAEGKRLVCDDDDHRWRDIAEDGGPERLDYLPEGTVIRIGDGSRYRKNREGNWCWTALRDPIGRTSEWILDQGLPIRIEREAEAAALREAHDGADPDATFDPATQVVVNRDDLRKVLYFCLEDGWSGQAIDGLRNALNGDLILGGEQE